MAVTRNLFLEGDSIEGPASGKGVSTIIASEVLPARIGDGLAHLLIHLWSLNRISFK